MTSAADQEPEVTPTADASAASASVDPAAIAAGLASADAESTDPAVVAAAAAAAAAAARVPTRREILRPVELLVIALIFGVFTGLIALMGSREPMLGLILGGVAFIVGLIGIAMFSLAIKPDDFEARDIHAQNTEGRQGPKAH
ncbi:hypothetical protein [Mycetocola tolaasinivorans]|uniref:hypothetical protein n=1 Tax=Mycetocola tolaasinivorans TaxID=76635 RepID=UPI0015FF43D6|nr:hypothetical protein [Mycetocola tolaasinivorans]